MSEDVLHGHALSSQGRHGHAEDEYCVALARKIQCKEQGHFAASPSLDVRAQPRRGFNKRRRRESTAFGKRSRIRCGLLALAATLPTAMAQSCISLSNSSQCSAFNASSISTDSTLTGLFPFLTDVTDTSSFDTQLQQYIDGSFAEQRYEQLIGCSAYNSSNTTHYYARYTTSVLCNAIIQNSIDACSLTGSATRPLCADTCAEYAESEEEISASNYCGTAGSYAISQIRADFTNCALPADSLSGSCIDGYQNQPDNCGFSDNLGSLCSYCAASSPNSTDSCCVYSKTETRCSGVVLPVVATSTMQPLFTSSSSTSSTSSATATFTPGTTTNRSRGLSGGAIAGIVVGSILGAFLLLALIIGACLLYRRRKQQQSPASSIFNQPSQGRAAQPPMVFRHDGAARSFEAPPGGRVTRMAAIEGVSRDGISRESEMSPAAAAYAEKSSSDEASPNSYALALPRRRRADSPSSGSALALAGEEQSGGEDAFSSPTTSHSEQLDFFKDYYSQDEIHTQDLVSVLWAYQPRAADEFELDRGDMLRVVGIWDDGWATGVMVRMNAEDWRPDDKIQRDSGMSGSSPGSSPEEYGDVKAFPLVCVCLPQHWRKTIEGDSTQGTGGPSESTQSP